MFKEIVELKHVRNFSAVILPISVAFFIYTFGWGVVSPMFSIYVNGITKNAFMTGLVLSMTTLFGIFLNVPFMVLIDRFNMKNALQLVLVAYTALALLYPAAQGVAFLLVITVVRGFASSLLWLISWAYVFGYSIKKVRGKESGFFSSMNDMASAIAPLVGGVATLVAFLFPFYILALTSFLAFVVVTVFLRSTPKVSGVPARKQLETILKSVRRRDFLKTVFLVVVFYALMNIFYSFISIYLNYRGLSVFWIGVVLTVSLLPAVLLEVPIGNLIDRHGIRKVLAGSSVLAAAFCIAFSASTNFFLMGAAILAFTLNYTAIFISLYARMSDMIREYGISLMGPIATIKDIGYTIGPLAGGALISVLGISTTFMATGAAFLLLVPIALTIGSHGPAQRRRK